MNSSRFDRWIAGLAGVLVGIVFNFALSRLLVWRAWGGRRRGYCRAHSSAFSTAAARASPAASAAACNCA